MSSDLDGSVVLSVTTEKISWLGGVGSFSDLFCSSLSSSRRVDFSSFFSDFPHLWLGTGSFLHLWNTVWIELVLFAILSGVLAFVLRERLVKLLLGAEAAVSSDMVGAELEISADIAAGALGHGLLHGSSWKVKNTGQSTVEKGERLKVRAVDGVTLEVSK